MTMVELLYAALLSYFAVLNVGYLVLSLLASRQTHLRMEQARYTDYELIANSRVTIPVSVIIPAYNEQESLVPAVQSALRSNHPEFEVILVNDGSTDRTLAVAREHFDMVENVHHVDAAARKSIERGNRFVLQKAFHGLVSLRIIRLMIRPARNF